MGSPIWRAGIAIALGACAPRPIAQPSPVFESDVRAPDAERAAPRDTTAAPVPPLPGGSEQTETEYAAICERLRRDVRAEAQNIDGGARLVLRPSSTAAMMRVRRAARDLEREAPTATGASTEPPCALFELAERGASFRVHEKGGAVLIDVTGKPEDRAAVRAALRRYADAGRRPPP